MDFISNSFFFLILLLAFHGCSMKGSTVASSFSRTVINHLPGFEGRLPFHLETGYVGVGNSEEDQLFYYFVESENNPREDPLLLWLTGGPGCSAITGLVYGIGPLHFKNLVFAGGIPPMELNHNSWTKVSNVLFVDLPAGTGFSYTNGTRDWPTGDFDWVKETVQFLKKWLKNHPKFISNPLYIGGDSYAGKIVPVVVFEIANGIERGEEPHLNLKGYLVGNPVTDAHIETNSKVPFAHGMALISDELYESAKKNCKDDYANSSNPECKNDLDAIKGLLSHINWAHILEKDCPFEEPKPSELVDGRRYLVESQLYIPPQPLPHYGCRTYGYLLSYYWANNQIVKSALGTRKGSKNEWIRCNKTAPFTYEIKNATEYHLNLTMRRYRALVYSGDHDLLVTLVGTQAWIRSLNFSIVDDWRPWIVNGQVAGFTRKYYNNLTFATIKGGGHTSPEYKPLECFAMFTRWISGSPL